jgi:hypothetical protein
MSLSCEQVGTVLAEFARYTEANHELSLKLAHTDEGWVFKFHELAICQVAETPSYHELFSHVVGGVPGHSTHDRCLRSYQLAQALHVLVHGLNEAGIYIE